MTIQLGYWAIPLALMVAAFAWAGFKDFERMRNPNSSHGYGDIVEAFASLFRFAAATVAALLAWCIYFACLAIGAA